MIAVATGLRLVQLGHDVRLDVAGDGPLREEILSAGAKNERLKVHVHGWLDRDRLNQLYAHAHFVLLPSATEGFPKVLAEGMAFGAVPVASDVGSVAQVFAEVDAGFVVTDNDAQTFAAVIDDIVSAPGRWQEASNRARAAAPSFTYARHVQAVVDLLGDRDGVES
jgi:glycosyltransferase involved in cell wall biosynthesis